MKVRQLGESGLIEHLASILGEAAWGGTKGVIRGIGDDAAVLQVTSGHRLLVSCDIMIEKKHFDFNHITPYQLGWKALAVNLSDIAAMGGQPRWALLSIGLKPSLEVAVVEGIYRGVSALAVREGVSVVGGNTSASPGPLILDVTVLGEVPRGSVLLRSTAEAGDFILVTGQVGSSAAGLVWLQEPSLQEKFSREEAEPLLKAHLEPQPRCREAALLAETGSVTAMIDLSDGLAAGLLEIASEGGAGAVVHADRLPLHPAAVKLSALAGREPLDWALYGGEDYELLFTVGGKPGAGRLSRHTVRLVQGLTSTPVSVIGQMSDPGAGVRLQLKDGTSRLLERDSVFDHFRS